VFDSAGNSRILSATTSKSGASNPNTNPSIDPTKPIVPIVRCYVPIKIRFSLLGVCIRSLRARGKNKKKSRSKNSVGMLTIGETVHYGFLVNPQVVYGIVFAM